MKIKKIPSPKHTSYVKLWVGVLCYPVTTRTALEILYLSRFFLQLPNPVTHVFLFAAGCHIVIIRRGDILKYCKKFTSFPYSCFRLDQGFKNIFQFSKIHRIWKNILSEYFVLPLGSVCVVKSFIFPLVRSQYSTSV